MSLNMKWPGSGSAIVSISGSTSSSLDMTPFGIYDLDHDFYTDAPKTAAWCAKRLGYPVIDIEMVDEQFYACFEEATSEYSAQVNQFNIRNNLFLLKGQDNANSFSQKNVDGAGLGTINRISQAYGTMVGVGGDVSIKKAYINLTSQVQKYDLKTSLYSGESSNFGALLSSSVKRDIMRVYYEATPAITRFFDPYSVGAQGTLNLMSELGFGNFSPAAQFLMMPLYEDVLRMQQIEFNDTIRKYAFSFNIVNNKLEIFPLPTDGTRARIYYEYFERDTFENNSSIVQDGVVADYSNIRYDFIPYIKINEVGKQWIRKYTLALAKELLGAIREKYSTIPIPDGEISLDGAALRAEAQVEKDELVKQLRENLEELGRKNQFEIRKNEADYHQDMLRKIPLKLYVG
jgi:hypothetical protein